MDRDCLNCGESISPSKRKDSVYCSKSCGRSHFGDDPIRPQAAAKYLWGNWSPEIEARAPEYLWAISG